MGDMLRAFAAAGDSRPPKDWPKDGRAVTARLHRIAPALRKLGWTFSEQRDSHTKLIEWTFSQPSATEKAREDHRSSPQLPQLSGDAVMSSDEYGPTQDVPREDKACPRHTRFGPRQHCRDCHPAAVR